MYHNMLLTCCYCNVVEVINGIQSKRVFLKVFAFVPQVVVNPLESRGNYSATSNNMKLVRWPLMGGLFISYSDEGTGRGPRRPDPFSLYQMLQPTRQRPVYQSPYCCISAVLM